MFSVNRRDYLLSVGGAGVGAAGVVSYELISDAQELKPPDSLKGASKVDVFLIAGQSNARGKGSAEGSPDPPSNAAAQYSLRSKDGFKHMTDPVGLAGYQAQTGSAWPAFADTYWKETNSPSVYVPTAIGGTGMHPDSSNSDVWGGSNSLLHRALRYLNGALDTLEDTGLTTNYRGILWHQGEKDAQTIDNGGMSSSEFKNEFIDMISVYRSMIDDSQARFWILQLGRPASGDTDGYQSVRQIQEEVAASDPYTTVVFDEAVNFPDEGKMTDDVHYSQQGLNEMGRKVATNIVNKLNIS
jgi:hypothetical protein